MSELTTANFSLSSGKRKADRQLAALQEDYEEIEAEANEAQENLLKAMEQSARLQSDSTTQREHLSRLEKAKVNERRL